MLIGLYGGTFDPVHSGHVHAAESVRKFLGLDKCAWCLLPSLRISPWLMRRPRIDGPCSEPHARIIAG